MLVTLCASHGAHPHKLILMSYVPGPAGTVTDARIVANKLTDLNKKYANRNSNAWYTRG